MSNTDLKLINNLDNTGDYPIFNIGTKQGNLLAKNTLVKRIKDLCDDLEISIHDNGYFKPNNNDGVLYNYFNKKVRTLSAVEKVVYLDNLLLQLFELQKSRITIPSEHSKFKKYYLDTLYFMDVDYPLYKECTFKQVFRKGYTNAFFVNGSEVMQTIVDSEDRLEKGRNSIFMEYEMAQNENPGLNLPNQNSVGSIFSFYYEGNKNEKNALSKVKPKINNFLNTVLSEELKKICDKLSKPLELNNQTTIKDLTELFEKYFSFAFVSLKKDLGVNRSMKIENYKDKNSDKILLPTMSVLDYEENIWVKTDYIISLVLSILRDKDQFHQSTHTMMTKILYNMLINDNNTDVLVFGSYIMPFKNGNFNLLTQKLNKNPNPFKEPVPCRFNVKLNRDADYKNYNKFGTTPYDFVTFPFKSVADNDKEAENRGIYAGLMIADILTPFSRAIGNDSIYWLLGAGGSGKTIYSEMLTFLVGGNQSKSVEVASLDEDKFALGNISQTYLLIGNEATENGKVGVRKLKQIATGDRLKFEEKFVQGKDCVPVCTVVITSNGHPKLMQDGGASERRFRIIKFDSVFQQESISSQYKEENGRKENPLVEQAIRDEYFLECIANYAVDMAIQHAIYTKDENNNPTSMKFPIPDSIKADTSESVKQNDTVAQFADFLGNNVDKVEKLIPEALYSLYNAYFKFLGKDKYTVGFDKFKDEIIRHPNIVSIKKNDGFFDYKGTKLRRTARISRLQVIDTLKDIMNTVLGYDKNSYDNNFNIDSNTFGFNNKSDDSKENFDYTFIKDANTFGFKNEKSQTKQVFWLLPFEDDKKDNQSQTTDDLFENAKKNNKDINEEDLPF